MPHSKTYPESWNDLPEEIKERLGAKVRLLYNLADASFKQAQNTRLIPAISPDVSELASSYEGYARAAIREMAIILHTGHDTQVTPFDLDLINPIKKHIERRPKIKFW